MCFLCGGNRTTHFILGLILVSVIFSLGLALSILGEASHRLEMCQVEPSLNLWMMTAGKKVCVIGTGNVNSLLS